MPIGLDLLLPLGNQAKQIGIFKKGEVYMKFQNPQIEITRFTVQDVITTSFELSDTPIEDFMQNANIPEGGFPIKGK